MKPGRPMVRTAKSSCLGNISTRIGPVGLNWCRLRQRVERLPRQLHHVLAHDSGFVRMQADDEIPVANRLELVDRVEHRELIERQRRCRDPP